MEKLVCLLLVHYHVILENLLEHIMAYLNKQVFHQNVNLLDFLLHQIRVIKPDYAFMQHIFVVEIMLMYKHVP